MIMGGWSKGTLRETVEALQDDGSSVIQSWNLNYDTVYGDITNIVSIQCYNIVAEQPVALT